MGDDSALHFCGPLVGDWTLGEVDDGHDYTGVGRDIRLAREATGQHIADVAQALRIAAHYLEAIEGGRFGDLPSAVYSLGFVRSFAGYLRLDADEMVRRVRLELEPVVIVTEPQYAPLAPQDQPRPTRTLLLFALVLAMLVFGLWYLNMDKDVETGQELDPVSGSAEMQAGPPVAPEAGASKDGATAASVETSPPLLSEPPPEAESEAPQIPPIEELVGQDPAADPSWSGTGNEDMQDLAAPDGSAAMLAEEVGPVEITSGTAIPFAELIDGLSDGAPPTLPPSPPLVEPAPEPAVPDQALSKAPVVLRASSDIWMRVSRANGEVLKSWVMRAGEQYVPPQGEAGLKVMIGNAAALTVYVEGAAMPVLGAKGEVIRALSLDIADLKAKYGR